MPARRSHSATKSTRKSTAAGGRALEAHLLDVGDKPYGDSLVLKVGADTVLVDGAHPENRAARPGHASIPEQLGQVLATQAPFHVNLLVVSHAHADHIGSLPFLVRDDQLGAEWVLALDPDVAFGPGGQDRAAMDIRVRAVAAALREEVLPPDTPKDELDAFLADAVTLEQRYREMLAQLKAGGATVVLYGRDDTKELVDRFGPAGLALLGPSDKQLDITRRVIAQIDQIARDAVNRLLTRDGALSPADLYLRLTNGGIDAVDAGRAGNAVNLQSIVMRFAQSRRKLLLNGDMQLASSGIANEELDAELEALRKAIADDAPYSFYKLPHHGSDNGTDEPLLDSLKNTGVLGICTGSESTTHPNPSVLAMLEARKEHLTWVRTDRNGLSSIVWTDKAEVRVSKGQVSDPTPNTDVRPKSTVALTGAPVAARTSTSTRTVVGGRVGNGIEVITHIPNQHVRVRLSIEVEPLGPSAGVTTRSTTAGPSKDTGVLPALQLGGGRELPKLLFVTNADMLAANIGSNEASTVIDHLLERGHALVADADASDANVAASQVHERLRTEPDVRGVVLVGGYDVVRSRQLDCLPDYLRRQIPAGHGDPDEFYVWSDDGYAATEGDAAVLPVSRIPDARSAPFLFTALSAGDGKNSERGGIRNVARPFAGGIYELLPGRAVMGISDPMRTASVPTELLLATRAYFMLHGADRDGTRFWGEDDLGGYPEALHVGGLPPSGPNVIFAGCCWGALSVQEKAVELARGGAPTPRVPEASLALSFLQRGAIAFVGCTGAHYSPDEEPYEFYGGPLHKAFWREHLSGKPPALALLEAKRAFAAGMFHGLEGPANRKSQAIEYKTLHQFTTLGLGW